MKNVIIAALVTHIIAQMDFWECEPGQVVLWLFLAILTAIQCLDWKIREWREGSEKENECDRYCRAGMHSYPAGDRDNWNDITRLCG